MTVPITPDERAAMRRRYEPGPMGSPERTGVERKASQGLTARVDVPRLLDALDTAEAEAARLLTERRCSDMEVYAETWNAGYENAMAQGLADDPTLADDWLVEHDERVRRAAEAERDEARAEVARLRAEFAAADDLAKRYRARVWTLDARLAALGYPKCVCHPADDDSERCLPHPETWTRDQALAKVDRQRDRLRAREEQVRRLRAEVTRLHELVATERAARPAPVWDEDTVTEAMARAANPRKFRDGYAPFRGFGETRSDDELRECAREAERHKMRNVLAVVRRHLPVRPNRETIARAFFDAGAKAAAEEFGLDEPVSWDSLKDTDVARLLAQADAVLDLWPGESRATVQAEALRDAADAMDADPEFRDPLRLKSDWLRARADRLDPRGADRG